MKSKILGLLCISVFFITALLSLTSATFTVSPTSLIFNQNTNSHTFTLTNTNNSQLLTVNMQSTITLSGLVFDITGNMSNINASEPRTFTVTSRTSNDFSTIDFGSEISGNLLITNINNSNDNATVVITAENKDFCSYDNPGDLSVSIKSMSTISGFGSDEDYWYPLDEVEIEVNVENNGNDDIKNIALEWVLYTSDGQKITDGDESDFDLNDGKDETITFTFQIDPNDLDTNTEDYVLYIKATGTIKNGLNEGEKTCASDSDSIEIRLEDDFVILDSVKFSETVSCGSSLQITAEVWNIGLDDQEDIYVRIYDKDLNIDEIVEIGDIDSFDSKKLDVTLEIPQDAEEKTSALFFEVYDESNDIYQNQEDDEAIFDFPLKVEGCSLTPDILIFAEVSSGGSQGEETVIKATLTNSGKASTFKLGASGYEAWATLKSVDPTTIYIGEGQSEEILITLNLNKDAPTGLQDFFLEITLPDGTKETQPISINVLEKKSDLGSITGFFTEGNTFLKGFIIVDIIIIVIIVIVAIRILKK